MDHAFSCPGVTLLPKSRSGWRVAIWSVALIAGVFGLLSLFLNTYNRAMLAKDADHLFAQVLASGNIDVLHRQADARFQAAYSLEALDTFSRQSPQVFQRDQIEAKEIQWRTHAGELYLVLHAKVAGAEVRYVSAPSEQRSWRLVGIEPGLDIAIPRGLKLLK